MAVRALAGAASHAATTATGGDTFARSEVVAEAEKFFGKGAKGLAEVIQKAFEKYGAPNACIKGGEGAGTLRRRLAAGRVHRLPALNAEVQPHPDPVGEPGS